MANGILENLVFFDSTGYSDIIEALDKTKKEQGDPVSMKRKKMFIIFMRMNFIQKM